MALGSQWYILFNTIAGAMAIPTDLREAMDNLRITGWQRWKRLIIPGIFPFYVTAKQVRCSEDMATAFQLFRVFGYGKSPRAYVLAGSLRERFSSAARRSS